MVPATLSGPLILLDNFYYALFVQALFNRALLWQLTTSTTTTWQISFFEVSYSLNRRVMPLLFYLLLYPPHCSLL
jgi:hypothetical protein